MTTREYQELIKWKKPSKYRNIKTEVDGITFDSRREARDYMRLKHLQEHGFITNLELQPKFPIVINNIKICVVILDFAFTALKPFELKAKKTSYPCITGQKAYLDSKGKDTSLSRLKRKLVKACHGVEVWIT